MLFGWFSVAKKTPKSMAPLGVLVLFLCFHLEENVHLSPFTYRFASSWPLSMARGTRVGPKPKDKAAGGQKAGAPYDP